MNNFFYDRFTYSNFGSLALFLNLIYLVGCVSPKQLVYFQNLTNKPDSLLLKPFTTLIQPSDLLSIQVSSLNLEASSLFNPYLAQMMPSSSSPTTPLPSTSGYLVATDSTVMLPLLGRIRVAGKTNALAAEEIRLKLKPYLKEPTVSVRNLNFRITVLGEVTRPSIFNITNERITLPEALGLAGDLTIYGRRDNVLIIREENGQRFYLRLNLTKKDLFLSPYYYLHPNDVIYIEPGKSRVASADRFYQTVPIILSALSFVAIIVTRR